MSLKLIASCMVALLLGCSDGPQLKGVSGIVTLDGKPLPGAMVVFEPEEGRSAIGRTDQSGRYVLKYTGNKSGAIAGEYAVSVSTYQTADLDTGTAEQAEQVPSKYNEKTTLKASVGEDTSEINFELESGGEMPVIDKSRE